MVITRSNLLLLVWAWGILPLHAADDIAPRRKTTSEVYSLADPAVSFDDAEKALAEINKRVLRVPASEQQFTSQANGFMARSTIKRSRGDIVGAIKDLGEAIRFAPKWAPTWATPYVARATLWKSLGNNDLADADCDEALSIFNKLIKGQPDDAVNYGWRANTYLIKGDVERAMTDIDNAVRLDPKNEMLFEIRSSILFEQGKLDEAIAEMDTVIRLNPKYRDAHVIRGRLWRLKHNTTKSLEDISEAVRLSPGPNKYLERSGIWEEHGQFDKAIADIDQSLRLYPGNSKAFRRRGRIFAKINRLEEAIRDFNAMVDLKTEAGLGLAERGLCWGLIVDYGDTALSQ